MSHGSPFGNDWAEMIALVLVFVGIVIGVLSPNIWVTYAIAILTGMLCGRWWVERKYRGQGPYGLIMAGFILGYVIGTFRGSRLLTFVLFMVGFIAMVKMMNKGLFKDILY